MPGCSTRALSSGRTTPASCSWGDPGGARDGGRRWPRGSAGGSRAGGRRDSRFKGASGVARELVEVDPLVPHGEEEGGRVPNEAHDDGDRHEQIPPLFLELALGARHDGPPDLVHVVRGPGLAVVGAEAAPRDLPERLAQCLYLVPAVQGVVPACGGGRGVGRRGKTLARLRSGVGVPGSPGEFPPLGSDVVPPALARTDRRRGVGTFFALVLTARGGVRVDGPAAAAGAVREATRGDIRAGVGAKGLRQFLDRWRGGSEWIFPRGV